MTIKTSQKRFVVLVPNDVDLNTINPIECQIVADTEGFELPAETAEFFAIRITDAFSHINKHHMSDIDWHVEVMDGSHRIVQGLRRSRSRSKLPGCMNNSPSI